jgi:hypothetical protein
MEASATACSWCGAGGDNGSAASFVVPPLPVTSPAVALAEAAPVLDAALPPVTAEPLSAAQKDLGGIGGWLIVVAIGLGLGPFALLLSAGGALLLLMSPMSQDLLAAHPEVARLLMLSAAIDSVLILALILLNILFYGKKKFFPRAAIVFLVANFILDLAAHQMLLQFIPTFPSTGAFMSLVSAAIWIPYFLLSQRVKQTFVN